MKTRIKAAAALLAVFFLAGTALFAADTYDKAAVGKAMRQNGMLMGQIKTAVNGDDWATAEVKFKELAEVNKGLKAYTPLKGEKAAWDKFYDDLVSAALKGAEASKAKDKSGAAKALADMNAAMVAGHKAFR